MSKRQGKKGSDVATSAKRKIVAGQLYNQVRERARDLVIPDLQKGIELRLNGVDMQGASITTNTVITYEDGLEPLVVGYVCFGEVDEMRGLCAIFTGPNDIKGRDRIRYLKGNSRPSATFES
jgi:hypothetical protein